MKAVDIYQSEHQYLSAQIQYLEANAALPESLRSDLLRACIVFAVSAFDRFMHDFVIERFMSLLATSAIIPDRAKNIKIGFNILCILHNNTSPNAYAEVEKALREHLSWQSFQHPDKVSSILSALFNGEIWSKLSLNMAMSERDAKTTLELIVDRRDKIAHEADIRNESLASGSGIEKYPIDVITVQEALSFINNLVISIDALT